MGYASSRDRIIRMVDGLTSRELLYHLPCEYSARKLDRFGNGWRAPEPAVRTCCVVVTSPAFRHDLRFLERVEPLAVQQRLPLIPRVRVTSGMGAPASTCRSAVAICSSENLLFFMATLLGWRAARYRIVPVFAGQVFREEVRPILGGRQASQGIMGPLLVVTLHPFRTDLPDLV